MRICFELLDLLKAHKKGIRRAAVNSFGYIAKVSQASGTIQLVLCSHSSRLSGLKTSCLSCSPICVFKSVRVACVALLPSQLSLKLVGVSDTSLKIWGDTDAIYL